MALKLAGSTSGFVALDAPASAGSNTLVLPASNGSANQYLKNSGTAGTLEFATLAAGKILQIVAGTPDTSARTTTSATFVTGSSTCNVAITPASTSNKILVVASFTMSTSDGNDGVAATIYRDSTNLGPSEAGLAYGKSVDGVTALYFPTSLHYVDSPNTTSSITYQLRFLCHDADGDGGNARIGNTNYGTADADNTVPSVMYAMEFA